MSNSRARGPHNHTGFGQKVSNACRFEMPRHFEVPFTLFLKEAIQLP